MNNQIKITAVSDGSTPNVTYFLNVDELKKSAVSPETFRNPENGTKNYPESYMKKNWGIRVVNDNGNYSLKQIGNHDSFFSVHKIFDLTIKQIELPYILGMQIKVKFSKIIK